jgi:hypothetical protein
MSSLPAFATSSRPSDASTTEPCEVRCGTSSPRPPLETMTGPDSCPSALRRKPKTRFPSPSLL